MVELKREDFISQYPPLHKMNKQDAAHIWERPDINLYVHIPFCRKKCGFCYYKTFSNHGVPEDYFNALLKEIKLYSGMYRFQSVKVGTLYFGGGTPTLLDIKQIEILLNTIFRSFHFTDDFEFCCEARPGPETGFEKIELLKSMGMKRISIGCQSLDDYVLRSNGRNHASVHFYRTFENARKAGLFNINVDLMTGMVNQSLSSWLSTVEGIIALKPENIAIYKCQFYLNSQLYNAYKKGEIRVISDEDEVQYVNLGYRRLIDVGYLLSDHFSFMKAPEYDHVHRRKVWSGGELLGIGLSSHSNVNNYIFQNHSQMDQYINSINEERLPVSRAQKVSTRDRMVQRVVLGIKNTIMSTAAFEDEFGIPIFSVFDKELKILMDQGFLLIDTDVIKTTLNGAIFADDIVRLFYPEKHKNSMMGHVKRSDMLSNTIKI